MDVTPEEIWLLMSQGWSAQRIAERLEMRYATVLHYATRHAKTRKIGFVNGYVNPPPYLKFKDIRPDIDPTDYTHHNEYSKHFAGAEFEDNRPPELRGMDWPPNFELL